MDWGYFHGLGLPPWTGVTAMDWGYRHGLGYCYRMRYRLSSGPKRLPEADRVRQLPQSRQHCLNHVPVDVRQAAFDPIMVEA
jgi:hypothetical protein